MLTHTHTSNRRSVLSVDQRRRLAHGQLRSQRRPAPQCANAATLTQRGQAENHIKAWKRHLAADRTSCSRAAANQFRLMLHTGAYWLMWSLRRLMPKRSTWHVAQFDTLRLRLLKIAAQIVTLKTRVMLHLPSTCPYQSVLRLALGRMPRLIS
ncbi:transposase [Paeniroseomonas aquatica]|uniref:transposase n=1 Tax=Paeniroseomonas aquatica TaxID=373043 RepID=UPI003610A15D